MSRRDQHSPATGLGSSPRDAAGTASPLDSAGSASALDEAGSASALNGTRAASPLDTSLSTSPLDSAATVSPLDATETSPPLRRDGIHARDLRVEKQRANQPGFDFDVEPGGMLVVRGPAGHGKTALLLTIGGRMKPESGLLSVFGEDLPHHAGRIRAVTGIGPVRNVNDLDGALTVEEHSAERLIFAQPWYKPWTSKHRVAEFLAAANATIAEVNADPHVAADDPIGPLHGNDIVNELTPLSTFVLQIALAMIGGPKLLLVDDLDSLRERSDRRAAWSGLLALKRTWPNLIIVVTCEDDSDLDEVVPETTAPGLAITRIDILGPIPSS